MTESADTRAQHAELACARGRKWLDEGRPDLSIAERRPAMWRGWSNT
jgi:hypothetical protein